MDTQDPRLEELKNQPEANLTEKETENVPAPAQETEAEPVACQSETTDLEEEASNALAETQADANLPDAQPGEPLDKEQVSEDLAQTLNEEPQNEIPEVPAPENLEQLLNQAREVLDRPAANIGREDVNRLRQYFTILTKEEKSTVAETSKESDENTQETEKLAETVAAPEKSPEDMAREEEFHKILAQIKEKKAEYLAQVEAERAANLEKKNAIIAEIVALAVDTDNVNRAFPRYRELQDQFNAIGQVPATEETSVWKRFQDAREQFSDNLKINKELRDYDFKKNLEQKELIIAEAAKLNIISDIITAYRRLQELRDKWREIGPVAKELREDVWNRFKEVSQEVNKRYQAHFEERKAREAENEAAKTAICERVEALDFSSLNSFSAWEQMTQELKTAQEDWKKLGFASRKMNNALFTRFRATCDTFFALKATYYKNVKDELARNLAAKTALAEQAEALKDSTDWKKTTDQMVAMQKEWKTLGPVAKKYSDAVWKRFQTACDEFFARKKEATSDTRRTEQANLQAKRDLIRELDKITEETPKDEARALINDLQERWKAVGHVPFREKDKVYADFRERINQVRKQFDLNNSRERMNRFTENLEQLDGDENKILRERERQMRLLETRRAELRTYENNLGFLTAKSKNGNSLVRDFENKITRLRQEIAQQEEKIRLLDSKL